MNGLKNQKQHLQQALSYANMIEDCDTMIEVGRHVNYYKSLREEYLMKYGDSVGEIIKGSIDIAVVFDKSNLPFDQRLTEHLNAITA